MLFYLTILLFGFSCKNVSETKIDLILPIGLDTLESFIPENNPLTIEKVKLGKKLFFDKNLSINKTIACADCHDPVKGFADGHSVAIGVDSLTGSRSTPPIINRLFSKLQFWDGRAASLEDQAFGPIKNPIEMNNSVENVLGYLKSDATYKHDFKEAFEDGITKVNIEKAIASFERTLLSGNSKFDKYMTGNKKAMSKSAIRGLELFNSKDVNCIACHGGQNFTDEKFTNTGIGSEKEDPDLARYTVSKIDSNKLAFKNPTLRDIARTAPYMHDGSLKTLREVIDFYADGGIKNLHLSKKIKKIELSEQDKKDLIEFMRSLSGTNTWDYFKNQ